MGIFGLPAAAWIRTVEEAASQTPQPDLVWSGPEVPGLHARDTRRVYEELLGSAEHSVWASTFAFFEGPKAFEVLAKRMDEMPELRVTLLLNIQRQKGDTTAADHLVRKFADRFWQADWPGSSRPRVFFDPRSLELEGLSPLHDRPHQIDIRLRIDKNGMFTAEAYDPACGKRVEMAVQYEKEGV